MELIKCPENNGKEKIFDDTDGYRLPNLSMYECRQVLAWYSRNAEEPTAELK